MSSHLISRLPATVLPCVLSSRLTNDSLFMFLFKVKGFHHHSPAQGHHSSDSPLLIHSHQCTNRPSFLLFLKQQKNILSLDLIPCSGCCPFLRPFTSKLLEKLTYTCSSKLFPVISPQPTSVKFLSPRTPLQLLLPSSAETSIMLNPMVYPQTSNHLSAALETVHHSLLLETYLHLASRTPHL